jgi:predicted dehydrogenase
MIRIGIIGAGQAGVQHARAVQVTTKAAVAWVADTDPARGGPLAAQCGARFLADYHHGLAGADAVSICVPHALLADVAVAAARAGLHMLLEKPMATTLGDADRVIDEARRAGVVLMVGFVHRYRPEARRAHTLIAAGAIGAPCFITDRSTGGGQDTWPAWVQRADQGGGLLLYSGVHRIDRARWLMGRQVTGVQGSTEALLPGSDVDSSVGALLAFEGGGRAALTHHFHAVGVPNTWETDVHGTDGMIRIHTGEELEIFDRTGVSREAAGPDRRFEEEIDAFLDATAGRGRGIPSGEDGRDALAVALAIAESGATGAPVSLRRPASGEATGPRVPGGSR